MNTQAYRDKTVYITGGGNGIGRALALAFARRGAALALVDISREGLAETQADAAAAGAARVTTHVVDVARREQVETAAQEVLAAHGEVHYLFANAGVGFTGVSMDAVRPEELEWTFGVNVFGVFHTIQSLLPSMRAHGKPAHILCTASIAALNTPAGFDMGVYCANKVALPALMQGFRDSLTGAPIHVSTIYPGLTSTDIDQRSRDLRPAGDGAPAKLPGFLNPLNGEDAGAVAERIIAGMEAGLPHIFTHVAMAQPQASRYAAEISDAITACERLFAQDPVHS
ncbi:Short-chain dehydrogenase/reductase [Sphingomonas paucimobilis]|nr:Short-chain dehydrogenase/reductase [Sphingomonas paucimobilis]